MTNRPNDAPPGATMLSRVDDFPNQIRDAWALVSEARLKAVDPDDITNVVVLGMGGSAIGGDLVAGLVSTDCAVPVIVHRNYGLPAWVNQTSLVIASSYSGGTEETLSGWDAAGRAGAHRVAVTTGGKLAKRARENGADVVTFDYDAQPRAALGYSFTLLLGLLHRLDLIQDPGPDLETALATLTSNPAGQRIGNLAKGLCEFLSNGLPVILAAEHLGPVARRWTTQINENSKAWAFWNQYPELNHNMVVGLENPEALVKAAGEKNGAIRIIHLDSDHYHPQTRKRMEITREIMAKAGLKVETVEPGSNQTRLTELLLMTWIGDYVSLELSGTYNVDPTPVDVITELKKQLEG